MCRWIAYAGPPAPLERYLFAPEYSLVEQSRHARKARTTVNGDGFGVGWYGPRADEPGVYRDVRPAWGDENLASIARHVESRLFLAHVRASTGTATTRSNCHPFAHERWLFMHNGQIGEYPRVRRALEALLPDDLYTVRRGTTDSEALFLLLLALGVADDPGAAFRELIETVNRLCAERDIHQAFRFTCALADGESLVAVRYSSDEHPPTVFVQSVDDTCLVVSEPLDSRLEQWRAVPPGHLLRIGAGRPPEIQPLGI